MLLFKFVLPCQHKSQCPFANHRTVWYSSNIVGYKSVWGLNVLSMRQSTSCHVDIFPRSLLVDCGLLNCSQDCLLKNFIGSLFIIIFPFIQLRIALKVRENNNLTLDNRSFWNTINVICQQVLCMTNDT
jgi:hypothetical protein